MDPRKPFVSFPNVLFHLDACLLPTDDPSPAATGLAAASKCWLVQAAHRSTGTLAREPEGMLPLTHLVPFSVYTGKGNTYPAARNCGKCLQKAQTLPRMHAEDEKKSIMYTMLEQSLPPGEDTAFASCDFLY